MQIDTLRPSDVDAAGGWTTEPLASPLDVVTSDDDDNTYAESVTNSAFRCDLPAHTPATDHERHLVRARMRGRVGTGTGTVTYRPQTSAGTVVISNTAPLTTTPTDFSGSWSADPAFNLDSPNPLLFDIGAASPSPIDDVRVQELYLDVDTRAKPTFTPQILDGAGNNQAGGTVTDSNIVRTRYIDEDYDGLPALSWRVAIYTEDQTLAVGFEPFVSTPTSEASGVGVTQTINHILDNDDYVAYFELTSEIREGDPFDSDIVSVSFTVSVSVPFPPVNLSITPVVDPPSITICWEPFDPVDDPAPWENPEEVWAQVERTDCDGTRIIALIPDGLTACYTDRFMTLSRQGTFCGQEDHICQVCYRVRYWGVVDAVQDASFGLWDTAEWDDGLWGV